MTVTKEQIKSITEIINSATYSVVWSMGRWRQAEIDAMEEQINRVHLTRDQVAVAMQLIPEDEFEFDADDTPINQKIALWVGTDAAGAIMSRVRWSEENQDGIWAPESAGIKMEF